MKYGPYIIVARNDSVELEAAVCRRMADGYLPVGGVFLQPSNEEEYRFFYQAMILRSAYAVTWVAEGGAS